MKQFCHPFIAQWSDRLTYQSSYFNQSNSFSLFGSLMSQIIIKRFFIIMKHNFKLKQKSYVPFLMEVGLSLIWVVLSILKLLQYSWRKLHFKCTIWTWMTYVVASWLLHFQKAEGQKDFVLRCTKQNITELTILL